MKDFFTWEFCLFIIGLFDEEIFQTLHILIIQCDPDIFRGIGMIMIYILGYLFFRTKPPNKQ